MREWRGDEYSMCITDDHRLIITNDESNEQVVHQYEWWQQGGLQIDAEFFARALKMHEIPQRRVAA